MDNKKMKMEIINYQFVSHIAQKICFYRRNEDVNQ